MASLDDLLAARAAGPAASAPSIDDMLAHRATGGTIPVAAVTEPGFWAKAGGQASDFGSALLHHAMNLPHGAAQLVENAASGVANAVAPSSAATRYITDVVDADNAAMSKREADYQKGTPNSAGAYAGATIGEIAPFLAGGAGALNTIGERAASFVPSAAPKIVPKIVSGATQGALAGAAQPVTTATNLGDLVTGQQAPGYWDQKAAQVGLGATTMGALPVAGAIARPVINAVKNAAAPVLAPTSVVSPLVAKLVGDDPATLAMLRNPQQLVAGSRPTTAQLLATPEAVSTEKAFANQSPDFKNQLLTRSNENNSARTSAIAGVAGDQEALAKALQARSDATRPFISGLKDGAPVDVTPITTQLKALQESSLGTDPTVSKGVDDLLASIQKGATVTGKGDNLVRPDLLDGYRQNVRSFLQQNSSTGAVSTKQEAAFEPVRAAIVDSIESANPGYRDYLATYAQKSQPINTMEAAGGILDNVGGAGRAANSAGDSQVTLSKYSAALAKALSGPYDIDPAARSTLEGIQKDIQREGISNSVRAPGSDTAYNLNADGWLAKSLYGDSFSGTPKASQAVGGALGGIGGYMTGGGFGAATGAATGAAAMNRLGQFGQSRVNDIMARALTDPEFAAQLAAQAKQPSTNPLLQYAPQLGLLQ